jgi:hypothetical protein
MRGFDPLQKRDWHGRWALTAGGGDGGAGITSDGTPKKKSGGAAPPAQLAAGPKLSPAEHAALTSWTASSSHEIKAGYKGGKPTTPEARKFDAALHKLPPDGEDRLYRGSNERLLIDTDPEYDPKWRGPATSPEQIAEHFKARKGEHLEQGSPLSAAPEAGVFMSDRASTLEKFSRGPNSRVVYEIETKQGRDVHGYAMNREAWEGEHVIPPTEFEIVGARVGEIPGDRWNSDNPKPIPVPIVTLRDTSDRPEGLDLTKVHDFGFAGALDSGRWEFVPQEDKSGTYGRMVTYAQRPAGSAKLGRVYETSFGLQASRPTFYDPAVAEVRDGRVVPKDPSAQTEIPWKQDDGEFLYRGMSAEEWQSIQHAGTIQSTGEYNVGGDSQQGTTSFSTDPAQASNYAGGFAPWQLKPTFDRPAYIVKVRRDRSRERDNSAVYGGDTTEVDVEGAVPEGDIAGVMEVRPYAMREGEVDVGEKTFFGEFGGPPGALTTGGASRATGSYIYREIPAPLSYRMQHQAPGPDDAPATDLESLGARDIYGPRGLQIYGTGDDVADRESMAAVRSIRGKPEAEVTIYRAAPKSDVNHGDWVTLSRSYAEDHAKHPTDPAQDMPVASMTVKAKTLWWDGNSINEFGYAGPNVKGKPLT